MLRRRVGLQNLLREHVSGALRREPRHRPGGAVDSLRWRWWLRRSGERVRAMGVKLKTARETDTQRKKNRPVYPFGYGSPLLKYTPMCYKCLPLLYSIGTGSSWASGAQGWHGLLGPKEHGDTHQHGLVEQSWYWKPSLQGLQRK